MSCEKYRKIYDFLSVSCPVGDKSLSVNWFVGELFFVGEFLSVSCLSHSELLGQFLESDLGRITLDFMMT